MTMLLWLQGLVFAIWAVLMFLWLFDLRRRAVTRTGQAFPGPGSFLGSVVDWWRDPAMAQRRWLLPALTVLLFALIVAGVPRAG